LRLRELSKLIERVQLNTEDVEITIDRRAVLKMTCQSLSGDASFEPIVLRSTAARVWHGRQLRLVVSGPDTGDNRPPSPALVRLMADVHEARQLVLANPGLTLSGVARSAERCRVRLKELLRLACLSPEIVLAILEGREPIGLSNTMLLNTPLPLVWREQHELLGFT
jgi:hypothetical protein